MRRIEVEVFQGQPYLDTRRVFEEIYGDRHRNYSRFIKRHLTGSLTARQGNDYIQMNPSAEKTGRPPAVFYASLRLCREICYSIGTAASAKLYHEIRKMEGVVSASD